MLAFVAVIDLFPMAQDLDDVGYYNMTRDLEQADEFGRAVAESHAVAESQDLLQRDGVSPDSGKDTHSSGLEKSGEGEELGEFSAEPSGRSPLWPIRCFAGT